MRPVLAITLLISSLGSSGTSFAQGFGKPLAPTVPTLEKARVSRLLDMIPELASETSQYHWQFFSSLGTPMGAGALPSMPEGEMRKLERIYTKYGFTMEEFISELSVLLATYFSLDQKAFFDLLPSEAKPEIRAVLDDPAVPLSEKDKLRYRIKSAQKNKEKLLEFLVAQTNEANRALVRPLLKKIRRVFKSLERQRREALAGNSSKR